jgi:hypothetical protein
MFIGTLFANASAIIGLVMLMGRWTKSGRESTDGLDDAFAQYGDKSGVQNIVISGPMKS